MATGTRLATGAAVILTVTGYMVYVGAAPRWQYYLTVDECAETACELLGKPIRVSGTVARDSLCIAGNRMEATFQLAGATGALEVSCSGHLPDNLAEGREVVVEGRLTRICHLEGHKVLARCASKYSSQGRAASTTATDLPGARGSG